MQFLTPICENFFDDCAWARFSLRRRRVYIQREVISEEITRALEPKKEITSWTCRDLQRAPQLWEVHVVAPGIAGKKVCDLHMPRPSLHLESRWLVLGQLVISFEKHAGSFPSKVAMPPRVEVSQNLFWALFWSVCGSDTTTQRNQK